MLMTVGFVTRNAAVEDAYAVMQRADRMFPAGRYFSAPLSHEQVTALTAGLASFSTSTWLVKLIDRGTR